MFFISTEKFVRWLIKELFYSSETDHAFNLIVSLKVKVELNVTTLLFQV